MQVKRKVFPYPILNSNVNLSNYHTASFKLEYTFFDDEDNNRFVFKDIRYDCDSSLINEKCDNGELAVACIVECSNTIFRVTKILTRQPGTDLVLYKNDLSGRVDISIFAYSKIDTVLSNSVEFEEDYRGIDFEIDQYDILAADDGINFPVYHEEKQDNLAKSIFSINPVEDMKENNYEVHRKLHKIDIDMSKEIHQLYTKIYMSPTFKEAFFSMLLVPALIQALSECKEEFADGSDINDIEDSYVWFKSITLNYKRITGKDLTIEDFKQMSMVQLAQMLLGSPIKQSFESIRSTSYTKGEMADEQ